MDIELLVDAKNTLGEGPLWDTKEDRLYWVDSLGNAINRCDPKGGDWRTWHVPDNIGSLALRQKGGAVVALRNGFHFFDFDSGEAESIVDPEAGNEETRLNDGKVDRRGRFISGSMAYDEKSPISGLYRLDPDLRCHKLESGIVVSNGPCWSPDNQTFYFSDTWKAIYAYDYDIETGELSNTRSLVAIGEEPRGFPDGATVDSEGFLWSSQVYGGRINRYSPNGELEQSIEFPIQNITSVMFGGADLDILFVTSMARQPVRGKAPSDPRSGGLFAIYGLGVRGIPEPRFAG